MDHGREVDGELYSVLEECRARKRVKTNTDESHVSLSMETNGLAPNVGMQGLIKRRELVMLIEQALSNLGFSEVSEQLAEESGIKHETTTVTSFRTAILEGDYQQAVSLLTKIGLKDSKTLNQCKFVILEQKFLEVMSRSAVYSYLKSWIGDCLPIVIKQAFLLAAWHFKVWQKL